MKTWFEKYLRKTSTKTTSRLSRTLWFDRLEDRLAPAVQVLVDSPVNGLGTFADMSPNSNGTDDQTQNLFTITEGGAAQVYKLRLDADPGQDVTIYIQGDIDLQVGGSNSTQVTFTTGASGTWDDWQDVIVTASRDYIDQATLQRQINLTSSDITLATLPATNTQVYVTDVDTAGVTIVPINAATISESSPSNTHQYSVRLNSMPSSGANITVHMAADNTQVIVDQPDLGFNASNWNNPQIVTVTSIDDFVAEGAHTGKIIQSVSGNTEYDSVDMDPSVDPSDRTATYVINITDNDTATLVISSVNGTANLVAIPEGSSTTFSVALSSQPTGPVTVALTPASGSGQVILSTYTLTFTPTGTNVWSSAQTVTVTSVDNFSQDATTTGTTRSEAITLMATSSDPNYSTTSSTPAGTLAIDTVQSNIVDNDVAGVTVSPTGNLSVTEAGTTALYTFVLNTQPTGTNTVVTINLSDSFSQVTPSPSTLSFDATNWSTPQAVTLTAVADSIAEDSIQVSGIGTLSVGQTFFISGETGLPIHTIVRTTTNPATGSTSAISFSPGLQSQINNLAAVNGGGANPIVGGFNVNHVGGYGILGVPGSAGVVKYTVASSQDSNYNSALLAGNTTVNVVDNDVAGFVYKNDLNVVSGPLALTEGDTKLFYLKPTSRPAPGTNVIVDITVATGLQVIGSSSLTFDYNNYNYQQMAIKALQDFVVTGPVNKDITVTVRSTGSTDPQYLTFNAPTVVATITDIDTAGVTITPTTAPTLSEGGANGSYNLQLKSKPNSNVTLSLNQGSQLAIDRYTGFQTNWAPGYTVGATTMQVTTGSNVGAALVIGQTFTIGNDPVVHTITAGLAAATSGVISFTPPLGATINSSYTSGNPTITELRPAGANPVTAGRYFGRNEITISAGTAFLAGQTFFINGGGQAYTLLANTAAGAGSTMTFNPPLSGPVAAGAQILGGTVPSSPTLLPIRTVAATVTLPPTLTGVSSINVDGGNAQLSKGDVFYIATEAGGARLHTITSVTNSGTGGSTSVINFTPSIYGDIADNQPLTITPASQVFHVSDSVSGASFGPTITSLRTGINTITVTGGTGSFALGNTFTIENQDGDNTLYTVSRIDNDAVTFTPTLKANIAFGADITRVGAGTFNNYTVKNAAWTNGLNTATGLVNDGDTFTIWDTGPGQGEFIRTNSGITGTILSHANAGVDEATSTINFSSLTLAGPGNAGWVILVNSAQPNYTFTPFNYNQNQRVSLAAVRDFIPEGTSSPGKVQYVAASSDPFYNGIVLNATTVPIIDTLDPIAILVNKSSVSIVEGGSAQTFTVSLNAQPSNAVKVSVTLPVSFQSLLTLNDTSSVDLNYDATNWSTAQTVTLKALNNNNLDLTRTTSIFLNSTSVDGNFNLSKSLAVTVADANNTAPVNNLPSGEQSTGEENPFTFSAADSNAITISDGEATGVSQLLVNLSVNHGTLTLGTATGLDFSAPKGGGDGTNDADMSFQGTLSAINQALEGLVFTPEAGFFGTATLTIKTNDQNSAWPNGALTTTSALPITVTANPSNAGPKIVVTPTPSDGTGSAFAVAVGNNPFAINVSPASTTAKDLTFAPTNDEFYINGVKYSLQAMNGTTVGTNGNTGAIAFNEALAGKILPGTIIYQKASPTAPLSSTLFKVSGTYDPFTVSIKAGVGGGGVLLPGDHVTLEGTDSTGAAATREVIVTAQTQTAGSTSSISFSPALDIVLAVNDEVSNVIRATNEETARVFSKANGNGISITDPQYSATSLLKVTLDLDSSLDPTAVLGTLTLGSTVGLVATLGNNTSSVTFQGTLANVNLALNNLKYTPPKDLADTAITLNVRVDEMSPDADPDTPDFNVTTVVFDINQVNDRPTLALSTKAISVFSGAGSQTVHIINDALTIGGPSPAAGAESAISEYKLTFSNSSILKAGYGIDANGDFTFEPAAAGTTTVNVVAKDPDGTRNGGIDTSLTQTFTITISNSIKWTDSDGDIYTITLTGPGTLSPVQDLSEDPNSGPIQSIALSGTTANSTLSVTVNKKVFDGIVTIGGITTDSAIGVINVSASDLIGPVDIQGTLNSMTVRNISDDGDIKILGNARTTSTLGGSLTNSLNKAAITAIDIAAADITSDSILSLKAKSYGQGTIDAPAIAALAVSGDFQANLNLVGFTLDASATLAPATYTLQSATIGGKVLAPLVTPTWDIVGKVGKITVGGLIDDLSLEVSDTTNSPTLDGKIDALVLTTGLTKGNVTASSAIGAITAGKWLSEGGTASNSKITAASLGSLTTTGNFFADLELTSTAATVPALGNTTIGGNLADSTGGTKLITWSLKGDGGFANNLTVKGSVTKFALDAIDAAGNGKIAKVALGAVTDSNIEVTKTVGAVTATSWTNSTATAAIEATSMASLTVAGNFNANLTLSGTGNVAPVLSVGGNVTGAEGNLVDWDFSAGSVGTVSVKGTATYLNLDVSDDTDPARGNIASLTFGNAVNTTVEAGRAIGTLKANSWDNYTTTSTGSITAGSIGTFSITGTNVFESEVTLTGIGVTTGFALSSATFISAINNSIFEIAGSVKAFQAGGFATSQLLLNVDTTNLTGNDPATVEFDAAATLSSFVIKGSFTTSLVAAPTITLATIANLKTTDVVDDFGFSIADPNKITKLTISLVDSSTTNAGSFSNVTSKTINAFKVVSIV